MGISSIFDIASSGIAAQRLAIEVAGENIANVNTPGYSRQEVVMENRPVGTSNGFALGSGVQIQTVRRSYDGMLQQQIVNSNSTYQQNLARQQALQQIQPSFNELASDGLGKAVDNFFGAWQDLSANPAGSAERQALLSRSQILVDTFRQMNGSLATVARTADNNLVGIGAEVTDHARNLALVNTQILATNSVGGNANELLDQRDLLLQKLSDKIGITSTLASDGTATVTLAGGEQLVSGTRYATLYTRASAAVPPTNNIRLSGLGNPPPANNPALDADVTGTVGGVGNSLGELGGMLQVRDSIVPGYISKLDEMASTLVSAVNAQHSAGYGLDGLTGSNFFAAAGGSAATIALDGGLTAAKIAAGFPSVADPAPTSTGNNANTLKIAALQQTSFAFGTGSATLDGFYNAMVGGVGIDTQGAQNTAAQGAAFLKQLNALRSSNSAVSLDEELTNLTKYQRAFQGSAKVINAATEMLDVVMGLVR
ncbi:MAG: flagellar hook-associated protein FlgK [Geobacteraceae bacterium GWC2_58_44]|nr:MAG: flagellar hook-associated protein FlgK [Geobacteraceae bacterium GWC2_58_44]